MITKAECDPGNRFLLSSTTFSPAIFLSKVHNEASTDQLLQGLDFLSRSIEKKSASLKVLVESNFQRFIKAKATIDNVYNEMRNQGVDPAAEKRSLPHSRHASSSSWKHSRNASGLFSPNSKAQVGDKKKNALLKESEYGVQGIKTPLTEVSIKAEEVWGPALGGREREESLKGILSTLERHRGLFEVGGAIRDAIKRKDYETLVEEYNRARRYADDARDAANRANYNNIELTDAEVHQILVTARMWADVEEHVAVFKRDTRKRLTDVGSGKQTGADDSKPEEYLELIGVLLQLGVEENPITLWLQSRSENLKSKLSRTAEFSKVQIEVLRRRLANNDKPNLKTAASYLRSATSRERQNNTNMDSPKIIEFWDFVSSSMTALLASQNGVLGEVVEYWDIAQSFINGSAQRRLPVGIDKRSREHLDLSADSVEDVQNRATDLIHILRENIFVFFADPPIDDLSTILSPVPETPATPKSATLSPLDKTKFNFDPANPPPPSPSRGASWEKYAFWPPYANALSGVHYLSRILILVGTACGDMASLSVIKHDPQHVEMLKILVGAVRERCVQAVCAAWEADAENARGLEDWIRSSERNDVTSMPERFVAFEREIVSGMQRMCYLQEARGSKKEGAEVEVLVPPPQKLVQTVRSQFVKSLYKALSGMVENAERRKNTNDGTIDDDADGLTIPARSGHTDFSASATIDANSKVSLHLPSSYMIELSTMQNVRKLLILSNLQHLRKDLVAYLLSHFETSFSVKLTDESKTIRDVVSQIDARLFQSYTRPLVDRLATLIRTGVADPSWIPRVRRPEDARPYVYNVLLTLVAVQSEVSITAVAVPDHILTKHILSYLLEQVCVALMEAFKTRSTVNNGAKYTLPMLMQATLDLEFLSQTLSVYTTEKVSAVQGQIYKELDERADVEAKENLPRELPEMRKSLKNLRERTRGEL